MAGARLARRKPSLTGAMKQTLRIRPAQPGDMRTIINMIDEAAGWLREKGTDQWASPWPNRKARDARVRRGITGGKTWVAEDAQGAAATITFRADANPKLWNALEQGDRAVYVSRLVVSRRSARRGIGSRLIDWAGLHAREDWNAQWIRIDVWTTNHALHKYYKNQGFEFCRLCDDTEYPSAALFQKPTARIAPPDMLCPENK
jgi:ribosomal protein S18 acetylase RimI-like enzyme